jgi:hypothetical protein
MVSGTEVCPEYWSKSDRLYAAAQRRILSGGAFWPSRGELSRHLKYIARARISEFESYMPSQAVAFLRPTSVRPRLQ